MGFDLHFVEEPEKSDDADDNCEISGYKRFAGGSMGWMAKIMAAAGVLDCEQREPQFPLWPPSGISPAAIRKIGAFLDNDARLRKILNPKEYKVVRGYVEAREAVVRVLPTKREKVPGFKFGSNDGWWVSPAECRTIARGLKRALQEGALDLGAFAAKFDSDPDMVRVMIEEWIDFNQAAAEHGGFRVR